MSAAPNRKYVLVVEDDPEVRELYMDGFGEYSYDGNPVTFIEAKDGREGLQKISNQAFQCILTDLSMPRMTGEELLAATKKSIHNKYTPVVVVSAFPREKLVEEYDHLTQVSKPIKMDALLKLIETQLKLGALNRRISRKKFQLVKDKAQVLLEDWIGVQTKFQGLKPFLPSANIELGPTLAFKITLNSDPYYFAISIGPKLAVKLSSLPWKDQTLKAVKELVGQFVDKDVQKSELEFAWIDPVPAAFQQCKLIAGKKGISERIAFDDMWVEVIAFQP